jgi:alpha-galactosidase
MRSYLTAAVGNYSLDVLRLDFNTDPAPNWVAADTPGRPGIVELRYISGLYALWDAVLGDHPGLLIDNCASGGRRIDLETLSRSVPLWRSDNPGDSIQQQVQSMGLSGFAPISSGGVAWVDPYTWRSSGVVGKTADWGEAGWQTLMANASALEQLQAAVAETQRLRPLAIFGDYFPLTPIVYDDTLWAAYQFHCAGGSTRVTSCPTVNGAGWAAVFRRPGVPPGPFHLALYGIATGGEYAVRWYNESYTLSGEEQAMPGTQLASWDLWLPALPTGSSLVLEYECTAFCGSF